MNKIIAVISFLTFFNFISPAQTEYVLNILPLQKGASGEDLKLRIEFTKTSEISEAKLFYRSSAEEQFKVIEIPIPRENIVTITIPDKDVKAPSLELFIEITDKKGKISYFPSESPDKLMQIPVSAPEESGEIIILSPERDSSVRLDELIISASLIGVENFDPSRTQVLFDNVDVTKFSVISSEVVIFVPENVKFPIKPGSHRATIILKDSLDKIIARTSWNFNVLSPMEVAEERRGINYRTNFELELRQESLQKKSNFYGRGRANFNGSYSIFNFNTNLYLTSEERSNIQPQHRFLIEGNLLDWVRVGYGDVYLNFSPLVLSGYRVRGFYGKVDLRYFYVEFVNGQTRRGIEGAITREIPIDSLAGRDLPANSVYDTTNNKVLIYNYGTFARNLFAIKPAFKYKNKFELGFTYLVSEDDKNSIKFGGNPQKNVVLGSNFLLSIDNARTEIRANSALSVRNENLKARSWTDADIDSLFKDTPSLRDNLKKYRPLIEKFVPINQYIVPINPLGLSSLAYEAGVNLNYFGNFLKFDYIFHGNEYLSFGQPYLRQDIQGFKVFDRLRLLRNQLFLTFRYENLSDNTKNQRDYTTKFSNLEISAMYSPLANLPDLSVTYLRSTSDNGLIYDTLRAVNVKVDKVSFDVSYNFEFVFRNRISLNFSIMNSNDQTVLNSDLKNTSFFLSLYSDIRENLRGNFLFALNNSNFKRPTFDSMNKFIGTRSEKFNYISFGAGADYRVRDIRVWGSLAPSFGDLKRLYIYFGGEYQLARNQSLMFNCNLLFYSYVDIVAYVTYRISF